MMARRGEAVWRAPHNEPQRSQRARQALPKGASRCFRPRFRSRWQCSCEDSMSLPSRKSEALSERDLIRGSLEAHFSAQLNQVPGCNAAMVIATSARQFDVQAIE